MLKYSNDTGFEDWNQYLKPYIVGIIKRLKSDFPPIAHLIT